MPNYSNQNPSPDSAVVYEAPAAPACPVGEKHCVVIDEVKALREEVAQLAKQVRTDTLTGLFNYRHLLAVLEQEMERTQRTGHPTAIIMVDLDYFKQVNDRWGHEVGNLALKSTAEILHQVTRRLDIPCRYGGEEFAVVLPSTDLMTAIRVAERIRESIEAHPLLVADETIGLTASLGVDLYHAHQSDTPEQLIARADQWLYTAKKAGRNRVCHAPADIRSDAAVSKEERDLLVGIFGNEEE